MLESATLKAGLPAYDIHYNKYGALILQLHFQKCILKNQNNNTPANLEMCFVPAIKAERY